MSENIKPVATLHDDGYFTFSKPGTITHAGWRMEVFDQAALEAVRQEGFRSGLELEKAALIQQEQEIAELRRQLAAAQAKMRVVSEDLKRAHSEQSALSGSALLAGERIVSGDIEACYSIACKVLGQLHVAFADLGSEDTAALDTLLADKERETLERCAYIAETRQFGFVAAHAIRALMTKEKSDENNT